MEGEQIGRPHLRACTGPSSSMGQPVWILLRNRLLQLGAWKSLSSDRNRLNPGARGAFSAAGLPVFLG